MNTNQYLNLLNYIRQLIKGLLNIKNSISSELREDKFIENCLEVFRYQCTNNKVYRDWIRHLKVEPSEINSLEKIPFLPIEFFKSKRVISSPTDENTIVFTSSSTTSQVPASHYVTDISVYEKSFLEGFHYFYGPPKDYCFLALLPSYLQRHGSSLVYMCQKLMEVSAHPLSGFFLDNVDELILRIRKLNNSGQKVILIGVSYALMDLSDQNIQLGDNFIVMETGGMKGTRKELLKSELHAYLKKGFACKTIHSEYGMTELLSQAYSLGNGVFKSPPWMRFLIREIDDPLRIRKDQRTGGINVIDLANVNSCSFIATKDLGLMNAKGELQLMGRYDNSDVRGCNLMFGSD